MACISRIGRGRHVLYATWVTGSQGTGDAAGVSQLIYAMLPGYFSASASMQAAHPQSEPPPEAGLTAVSHTSPGRYARERASNQATAYGHLYFTTLLGPGLQTRGFWRNLLFIYFKLFPLLVPTRGAKVPGFRTSCRQSPRLRESLLGLAPAGFRNEPRGPPGLNRTGTTGTLREQIITGTDLCVLWLPWCPTPRPPSSRP